MQYPPTKTTPRANQAEALSRALRHSGYMIAHDMGAGKTKTAIDYCTAVGAKKVLVLCPKSVVQVWPEQFDTHSAADFQILALDRWSVNRKAKMTSEFLQNNSDKMKVVVTNYESAWRPPLGPETYKHKIIDPGELCSQMWDVVILDESHRIKAPGGKASWFCKRLAARAARRLCLTGTPMPHSLLDIYAQFRFLDQTVYGTSFTRFRAKYAVMGGFNSRQVIGWQNLDDLHERFYSRAHRVKLEDVVDLPEAIHERRSFELGGKARSIYDELHNELCVSVEEGTVTADNALTKLLRLQQLTGGHIQFDDEETPQKVDTGKLDALQDLLIDLPLEPIVVFVRFTPEIMAIRRLITKKLGRKVYELSGKRNDMLTWKSDVDPSILVVQIQAGSEGVDLTRARYCIYYSVGFSLGTYEQSLRRTHRPGQTRKVVYYHLIARNTVDEQVYRSLREKRKVIESVLNQMTGGKTNECRLDEAMDGAKRLAR